MIEGEKDGAGTKQKNGRATKQPILRLRYQTSPVARKLLNAKDIRSIKSSFPEPQHDVCTEDEKYYSNGVRSRVEHLGVSWAAYQRWSASLLRNELWPVEHALRDAINDPNYQQRQKKRFQ